MSPKPTSPSQTWTTWMDVGSCSRSRFVPLDVSALGAGTSSNAATADESIAGEVARPSSSAKRLWGESAPAVHSSTQELRRLCIDDRTRIWAPQAEATPITRPSSQRVTERYSGLGSSSSRTGCLGRSGTLPAGCRDASAPRVHALGSVAAKRLPLLREDPDRQFLRTTPPVTALRSYQ